MPTLSNGNSFPDLTVRTVGGATLSLPGDFAGSFGVVLFYRGAWCPYCVAQLTAFSRAADKLAELGIKTVALSVDDAATAAAMVEKHRLRIPVGYGADADKLSAATGAYTNDNPRHLQSTGFVLNPKGKIVTAVYSTGAIGRLVADDVIGLVRYLKSQA